MSRLEPYTGALVTIPTKGFVPYPFCSLFETQDLKISGNINWGAGLKFNLDHHNLSNAIMSYGIHITIQGRPLLRNDFKPSDSWIEDRRKFATLLGLNFYDPSDYKLVSRAIPYVDIHLFRVFSYELLFHETELMGNTYKRMNIFLDKSGQLNMVLSKRHRSRKGTGEVEGMHMPEDTEINYHLVFDPDVPCFDIQAIHMGRIIKDFFERPESIRTNIRSKLLRHQYQTYYMFTTEPDHQQRHERCRASFVAVLNTLTEQIDKINSNLLIGSAMHLVLIDFFYSIKCDKTAVLDIDAYVAAYFDVIPGDLLDHEVVDSLEGERVELIGYMTGLLAVYRTYQDSDNIVDIVQAFETWSDANQVFIKAHSGSISPVSAKTLPQSLRASLIAPIVERQTLEDIKYEQDPLLKASISGQSSGLFAQVNVAEQQSSAATYKVASKN